jgi:hypothetical protein
MKLIWRATQPDGIAHAFGQLPFALCGQPNQPQRFDWPAHARCVDCLRIAEVRSTKKAS